MALPGELCSTCQTVLRDQEPGWFTPPGQTFDKFRDASIQGCVVCSTIWTKIHGDQFVGSWKPIQYSPENFGNANDPVHLFVIYHDPIKGKELRHDFLLIVASDDQFNSYFVHSDLQSTTSSEPTLTAASKWLGDCPANHPTCQALANLNSNRLPSFLPTRLLDIGSDGDADWSLRVTREDGLSSASVSYMTLSYRWGGNQKLRLLLSTLDQFRRGSPISNLPLLFKDFVTVARRFGIRYIWIDALCIIQDSVADWTAEAVMMSYVYANSACNIAASACNNPTESLFRSRDPKSVQPYMVTASPFATEPVSHYIFEDNYWNGQVMNGPLHERGWVFQERFLAPRVVYFGRDQVLWECAEEQKCESFPLGIPLQGSLKDMHPLLSHSSDGSPGSEEKLSLPAFHLWNTLIERYSRCDLTNASDKMFAVAGMAKLFCDVTGDQYVAGWFKSRLLESLAWRVLEPRRQFSLDYRAPSWSWASVDGRISTEGTNPDVEYLAEVVDVRVTAKGADDMTNITEGLLTLRGDSFVAVSHYLSSGKRVFLADGRQLTTRFYPDSLGSQFPEGKKVMCIPLLKESEISFDGSMEHRVFCIVVEEVNALPGGSSGSSSRYKRLGIFVLSAEEEIEHLCTMNVPRLIEII